MCFQSVKCGAWEVLLCSIFVENKWDLGSKVLTAMTDMPVIVHTIRDSRKIWEEKIGAG